MKKISIKLLKSIEQEIILGSPLFQVCENYGIQLSLFMKHYLSHDFSTDVLRLIFVEIINRFHLIKNENDNILSENYALRDILQKTYLSDLERLRLADELVSRYNLQVRTSCNICGIYPSKLRSFRSR